MENQPPKQNIDRRQNRYRLVIMNEDSFEEVTQFRLSRWTVYFAISTLFVSMVTLTVALIVFTPIKYYLPGAGYGNIQQLRELRALSLRSDSLQKSLMRQQQLNNQIIQVLKGEIKSVDTTVLNEDTITTVVKKKNERKSKRKRKK
jgi:hypothetical protein